MSVLRQWHADATQRVQWSTGVYQGLLDVTPEEIPTLFGDLDASRRRFLAVDANVWRIYGQQITDLLNRFGVEYSDPCIIQGGESAKTRDTARQVYKELEKFGVARFGEAPIAIGGGVLHDLFGMVAGEYRRGLTWEFIGTTVTAAIDAMFALKCAVNDEWKNRSGLYHPARYSWTDPRFFETLPLSDIRAGFAEVIKVAVAGDQVLFDLLEDNGPRVVGERFQGADEAAAEILARAIAWMMCELESNPWERNPARASYLGHNISPGIEPRLPHGRAVALDIAWTTMIAWRRDLVDLATRDRILQVIRSAGLEVWHPVMEESQRLIAALEDTALHRGGEQLVPTPIGIGSVTYLNDITTAELLGAVEDQHGVWLADAS
ncbi:iron-containing alcohol dehydrogenase [Nocardia sp. CNY236]|uniref:3-dehydroquinate synthase family protein n=1 Tax=Nocardia sp. CNY236 TaxID=1169152 RepID=UPI00041E950A|nr:iron-containing alcohol dehydrogenase [Nocardia sp. CNY236]